MREGLHPIGWAREWASSGRLSKPEGDVLKELATYARGDSPVAWPSNATIAASVQQTEKTIRRALDGLEEKGLVTRVRVVRDGTVQVLRSAEHPITMCVAFVATPAAGQLQFELGDQALVAADPRPRRRPAPSAAAPAVDEDELARRRREKIAADAAQVGATLHALNAAAEVAPDDPGRLTTGGEGRQETPEVPGKVHVQTEEECERASEPADPPVQPLNQSTYEAVMETLRAEFGAQADMFDAAIGTTLSAFPDGDHVAAAQMVVRCQQEAAVMGYAPIKVLSAKLAAELRKQTEPRTARAGGWPPSRRPRTTSAGAKSCPEVQRGSVLIRDFLAARGA